MVWATKKNDREKKSWKFQQWHLIILCMCDVNANDEFSRFLSPVFSLTQPASIRIYIVCSQIYRNHESYSYTQRTNIYLMCIALSFSCSVFWPFSSCSLDSPLCFFMIQNLYEKTSKKEKSRGEKLAFCSCELQCTWFG